MKLWLAVFAAVLVYDHADATVGNFLADQAIDKLSTWVQSKGATWLTLPGLFKQGDTTYGNNKAKYTLAFAGPTLKTIKLVTRSGEAAMDDTDKSKQTLSFVARMEQAEITYDHIAYSDDSVGYFDLSASVKCDGFDAQLTVNVNGEDDSCYGSINGVQVTFKEDLDIIVTGAKIDMPVVKTAIEAHFKDSMAKGVQLLMSSALFNSLQGYDICTGKFSSVPTANEMSNRMLDSMLKGMNKNMEQWALIPGFEKDTMVDKSKHKIIVGNGVFNKVGNVVKVGDAKYSTFKGWKWFFLDLKIETDNLQAFFQNIRYSTDTTDYDLSEIVTVDKISSALSVTFNYKPGTDIALCSKVWVQTKSIADSKITIQNRTPDIPSFVVDEINKILEFEIVNYLLLGAIDDLFTKAADYAANDACPNL